MHAIRKFRKINIIIAEYCNYFLWMHFLSFTILKKLVNLYCENIETDF